MWRLIYAVPSWILFLIFRTAVILFGWLVIPWAAILGCYVVRRSKYFDKNILAWSVNWIDVVYGNEEDGIHNGRQYYDMGDNDLQIIYWTAYRNPANNLRFIPYLSCQIDPKRVGYVGTFGTSKGAEDMYDKEYPHWFFAWCGFYTTFYWQFELLGKLRRFWIGWAIYPSDINGVTPYRKHGAGFKTQWKVVR